MGRLDRQFHDGVMDSLQRLKRAAEERARQAEAGKLDNRVS
jgi:hypothetical protein